MQQQGSDYAALKPLLVGGIIFAMVGLLMDVRGEISPHHSGNPHETCNGMINTQVVLSREQLAQLLTVPEREAKTRVRDILRDPYCQLPGLQVRAGVTAERDVYPLAFDPQTRLVILYEGDEYAGYRFSFQ
jgi:hypothetical protein